MPEPRTKLDPANTNVLIVEDDKLMVDVLNKNFTASQYKTFVVSRAEDAEKILAKEKIAVILLDIVLPDMDGFTFLKKIKADDKRKDIPVIIISNLGQRDEVTRGLAEGAADYIIKANVFPEEIVAKVAKLLQQ